MGTRAQWTGTIYQEQPRRPLSGQHYGGSCPYLRDVRVENDSEEAPICETIEPGELEIQTSPQDHLLPADWFLESAYTVCAQPPEGGEA